MSANGNGKPARKKSGKISGKKAGVLLPQKHGGALYVGGVPGNRGGSGRPTNEIRHRLRKLLDKKGIPFVDEVLTGEVTLRLREKCEHCGKEPTKPESFEELAKRIPSVGDRLAAFDSAARFSIGTVKGISEDQVVEKVRDTLQLVFDELGQDGYVRVLPRLRAIWRLGD